MKWLIFYHDGSSVSDETHTPETAPRDGVEVVVVRNATYGRLIWCRYEGYSWQDGTWVAHTTREALDQYLRLFPNGIVLNGFAIPDERFLKIYHQALADANVKMPANTNLPPVDTPLPMRFRAYMFSDEDWQT